MAPAPAPAGDHAALERCFALEPGEGAVVTALLGDALSSSGEAGRRLLAALGAGEPMGAALGLSRAETERLYARAVQWFAVGRPERAEPLFRALCLLDGGDADAWVGHGVCLHVADRPEAAALAMRTAAALRPDWAVPTFHLAALALRARAWTQAAALCECFAAQAAADPLVPAAMRAEVERFVLVIDERRRA